MSDSPHDPLLTRETLIIRLRDAEDDESWAEFAEIYTPLFYAYCKKREIRQRDTEDIVQLAMHLVSRGLDGFDYDPQRGKFKGWLFTILRNTISNYFRRELRAPITAAGPKMLHQIESTPDQNETHDWERDYQLRLLSWAVEKIKPEFNERIWKIFEETALKGRENAEVGEGLGMTKNAVAVARHRVTRRLREKTESVDAERWESEMIQRAGLD